MKKELSQNNKVQQLLQEFNVRHNWIVGFVDGEECFCRFLNKQKPTVKYASQIQPAFIVVQHERDIHILYRLQLFFNCGQVSKNKRKSDTSSNVWQWRVQQIQSL